MMPTREKAKKDMDKTLRNELNGRNKKINQEDKDMNKNSEIEIYSKLVEESKAKARNIETSFGYKPNITNNTPDKLNTLGLLLSTCKQNAWFSGKDKTCITNLGKYTNIKPGWNLVTTLNVGDKIVIGGIEVTATESKYFKQYTMESGKWVIVYWGKFLNAEGLDKGHIFQVFKESWRFQKYKEEKRKFYASMEKTEMEKEDINDNETEMTEAKENIKKIPVKKQNKKKPKFESEEIKTEDIEKMQKRIINNSANNLA